MPLLLLGTRLSPSPLTFATGFYSSCWLIPPLDSRKVSGGEGNREDRETGTTAAGEEGKQRQQPRLSIREGRCTSTRLPAVPRRRRQNEKEDRDSGPEWTEDCGLRSVVTKDREGKDCSRRGSRKVKQTGAGTRAARARNSTHPHLLKDFLLVFFVFGSAFQADQRRRGWRGWWPRRWRRRDRSGGAAAACCCQHVA